MDTITEAKRRLIEGNKRFASEKTKMTDIGKAKRQNLLENGQNPFAVIVCCSDSRVPPEIIFDLGLGDLFVIRTAGNIVDEIGFGSIEYAVVHLHVPLVVVLGHDHCGAVQATVEGNADTDGTAHIVAKIRRSLERVKDSAELYTACEDENIRQTVKEVANRSSIGLLANEGKVEVTGAKYCMQTGKVTFF